MLPVAKTTAIHKAWHLSNDIIIFSSLREINFWWFSKICSSTFQVYLFNSALQNFSISVQLTFWADILGWGIMYIIGYLAASMACPHFILIGLYRCDNLKCLQTLPNISLAKLPLVENYYYIIKDVGIMIL